MAIRAQPIAAVMAGSVFCRSALVLAAIVPQAGQFSSFAGTIAPQFLHFIIFNPMGGNRN
jgi:hypothetical protein